MKTNKLILFEDNFTSFNMVTYSSEAPVEFSPILGETVNLFDRDRFKEIEFETGKGSLFPMGKVRPVNLELPNSGTVVLIRLRPNHLLIDTTFSDKNIFKEVTFDTNNNRVVYYFYGFTGEKLTIRPKIEEDKYGILRHISEHLNDNTLRQMILDLLEAGSIPKNYLNEWSFNKADISIKLMSDVVKIRYYGIDYFLPDSPAVRDLVYILRYKGETSEADLRIKDWRGEKKGYDIGSLIKNYDRFKKKIIEDEEQRGIRDKDRFSNFLNAYLHISHKAPEIKFTAPDDKTWFFDLPEEFNK